MSQGRLQSNGKSSQVVSNTVLSKNRSDNEIECENHLDWEYCGFWRAFCPSATLEFMVYKHWTRHTEQDLDEIPASYIHALREVCWIQLMQEFIKGDATAFYSLWLQNTAN